MTNPKAKKKGLMALTKEELVKKINDLNNKIMNPPASTKSPPGSTSKCTNPDYVLNVVPDDETIEIKDDLDPALS